MSSQMFVEVPTSFDNLSKGLQDIVKTLGKEESNIVYGNYNPELFLDNMFFLPYDTFDMTGAVYLIHMENIKTLKCVSVLGPEVIVGVKENTSFSSIAFYYYGEEDTLYIVEIK